MLDAPRKLITSFPPLSARNATILILGSMPGVRSLAANEYYAHRQNAFWKIMGEIFGFNAHESYAERCQQLLQHRIAVWDVLFTCEREGSLDTAISSATVNDFVTFFKNHPEIKRICFNGAAAEQYFQRHVMPVLKDTQFSYVRLPSTSPAHASLTLAEKTLAWKRGLLIG